MYNAVASLVNLCTHWEPRLIKHKEEKEGLANLDVVRRRSRTECLLKANKQTNTHTLLDLLGSFA